MPLLLLQNLLFLHAACSVVLLVRAEKREERVVRDNMMSVVAATPTLPLACYG